MKYHLISKQNRCWIKLDWKMTKLLTSISFQDEKRKATVTTIT